MEEEREKKEAADEGRHQVREALRMMASLYGHMAKEMVLVLGEEEGKKAIARAVDRYGQERGERQYCKVRRVKKDNICPEDYVLQPDLPSLGWDVEKPDSPVNPTHVRITHCPLAELWIEEGIEEIGRIYCRVDEAKYQGFHSAGHILQLKNVLQGDDCCEMYCITRKNESGI